MTGLLLYFLAVFTLWSELPPHEKQNKQTCADLVRFADRSHLPFSLEVTAG